MILKIRRAGALHPVSRIFYGICIAYAPMMCTVHYAKGNLGFSSLYNVRKGRGKPDSK
jgi:hypothetical protein